MEQRTIHVGSITSTVDESALRSVFENCGTVTSVRIAGKPNMQTNYCFVEFSDARAAKTALAMNGLLVGDRNIKVQLAKSNPSGGGGSGTSSSSRPAAAQPAASAYNPPQYPGYPATAYAPPPGYSPYAPPAYPGYGPMPGYPAAGYPSPYGPAHHYPTAPTAVTSRHAAVASYTNSAARKRPSEPQDPERVARTVYVENLDAGFDEQGVADYFEAVGRISAVRINRAPDKNGVPRIWVEFETQGAAHDACELSGQQVNGAAIRVSPSKSAIVSNGLIRTDRPPGTEAGPAAASAAANAAYPAQAVGEAAAQYMAAAARTERPRPADSTSSSERAADLDEAPPGTVKPADTESESRRMGAAALMQHEWRQSDGAAVAEAPQAHASGEGPDDAAGHEGTNGYADGHRPGEDQNGDHADEGHAPAAADDEPAAKRSKVDD